MYLNCKIFLLIINDTNKCSKKKNMVIHLMRIEKYMINCNSIVCAMPLAHYYDVDREHSTKYTSSHCLLKNREAAEWYRNAG